MRRRRKTLMRWFGIVWLIALLILPAYWFRDEVLRTPGLGPEHIGMEQVDAQQGASREQAQGAASPAAKKPAANKPESGAEQTPKKTNKAKPGAASLLATEGSLAQQATSLGTPRKEVTAADEELIAKLEKAIDGGVGMTHLVVNDAATGETIFSYQDGPVAPASLLKVMTSLYALESLGPEHRFTTKTTLAGAASLDSANPELTVTIIGDGDANLTDQAITTLATETAAALEQALAEHQPQKFPRVRVRIDDSAFTGDGRNSNWNPMIYSGGNMVPIRPAAMYGGREAYGTQSERTGRDPNQVVAERFHRALGKQLQQHNLAVRLAPLEAQQVAKSPKQATELAKITSEPLAIELKHALTHSDNQMIETIMRAALVSQGLTADQQTVAAEIQRYVRGFGTAANAKQVELADANGLAAVYNTAPPSVLARAMTAVYVAAHDEQNPRHQVGRALLEALPVAGETGTLTGRFTSADTKGKMRAKTGSLLHAAGLAGVVEGTNGAYVFSITIDNALGAATEARVKIDRIIRELF